MSFFFLAGFAPNALGNQWLVQGRPRAQVTALRRGEKRDFYLQPEERR